MRVWVQASLFCIAILAGWSCFFRLASAGSLESVTIPYAVVPGLVQATGTTGILVNGVSGVAQNSPFTLTLDVELSTNAIRSRAAQPLTFFGTNGFVTIDAGSIFQATNGTITTFAATTGTITTLRTNLIQARVAGAIFFSNSSGVSIADDASANSSKFTATAGTLTLDVATAHGLLQLATGDSIGADLANITTINATTTTATNGNTTTENVTRLNATGPTGTVSSTLVLSQNATTTTLSVGTINGATPGVPISINQSGGFILSPSSGLNGTSFSASAGAFIIDVDGVGGRLSLNGTDIFQADRIESLGTSGTVSTTTLLATTATVVNLTATGTVSATTVLAGTVNVSAGGVNTTLVQSPTNNTSLSLAGSAGLPCVEIKDGGWLTIVGSLGVPTLAVSGSIVIDKSRGFSPFVVTGQGNGALERTYNVTDSDTALVGPNTAFLPVSQPFNVKKGALTTRGFLHYIANGRIGVHGGDTCDLGLFQGGSGGVKIAGPNGAFGVDALTDTTGSLISIDWTFTLRAPPTAATVGEGGGWAGVQLNNGINLAGISASVNNLNSGFRLLSGDIGGGTVSPNLSADTTVQLFVKWSSANAANTLKLTSQRYQLCQPQ